MRNFDEFRRRADAVRQIPLEAVLAFRGALRDRQDRAKWHTERGPLSMTGSRFTAWHTHHGGGGAIDLVMHLAQVDVGPAVQSAGRPHGPAAKWPRDGRTPAPPARR